MQFITLATLFTTFLSTMVTAGPMDVSPAAEIARRKDCGLGGCVEYYSNSACSASNGGKLGQYAPDCSGHCFQAAFSSVHVAGGSFDGTDCILFSDANCKDKVVDSGNVDMYGSCATATNAQSMICYYGCSH